MSLSSARPFAAPSYPTSPSATTASSLNYSQYGSTSFASPSRNPIASVSSSSYGAVAPARMGGPAPVRSAGLKPPGSAGGERKMESREVARSHWRALREFLRAWLEKESPSSRASAREKLTRLTKLQFQELSTDVYDELMRRINAENGSQESAVPFLPVRDDFHPKRNQARQKLATLPKNRFKDLASDVFHELRRRYPEFDEQDAIERSYDEEPPPAPGPAPMRPPYAQNPSQTSLRDRTRENPTPPPISRLASSSSQHLWQGSRNISGGSSVGDQSQHRSRPSRDREMINEKPNGYGDGQQPNLTAATNEVVVPNKSRLREEEIEVPYARDSQVMEVRRSLSRADSRSSLGRESQTSSIHDRARTPRDNRLDPMETLSPVTPDDREYYDRMSFSSNVTNKSKQAGQATGRNDEREQKIRAEYEFRIAGLERRTAMAEAERDEARRTEGGERDRRKEWEDEVRGLKERAATHASSLRSLQHELDVARDAAETARKHSEHTSRSAQQENGRWRDRCDGLEDELRRLEDEKPSWGARNGPGDDDQAVAELKGEIHSLVDELNALSLRNDEIMAEREQDAATVNDMEARVEEYRRKYDSVRIELRNLKATSTLFVSKPVTDDHLPASADGNIADVNVSSFQSAIDGLLAAARSSTPTGVLPAMKAIVEAITEIGEDVKAFEARPNLDVDVSRLESLKHESTTRLNSLMQAARNHAMASGLSPVSLLDAAAGHLSANVVELIRLLKIRRSAQSRDMRRRGSNLSIKEMVNRGDLKSANGNFDREYGVEERLKESPAVARRPADLPALSRPIDRIATPVETRPNGFNPAAAASAPQFRINSFQSASSGHRSDSFDLEREVSVTSDRQAPVRPTVGTRNINSSGHGYSRTSLTSATSGSSAVAPATAYDDTPAYGRKSAEVVDDSDVLGEGGDEQEWEDLKPYLDTQSSALVNSIQNLLAAIRTGGQGPALYEHLSEVIAIASSIVDVSTNSLPAALRPEGNVLLKELVKNTNMLSEAQESAKMGGGAQFEKNVRQQIASASFGVAKSLKALMKLGTE